MNGNVAAKSFSSFQVNDALLAKVVEAIQKGEADARRYSQVRSFEIYYEGFRQRMVLGRIMIIPAKIADSVEDFPAALLYGAMVKEIHPELQADLYTFKLGESEYDEYDKKGLQVIKEKLFKDSEGKFRSIVLFVPTWGNVRDYVVLKFNRDTELLTGMVRHQIFAAHYNPALSSAFDHLSNDTDKLNVSDITPKITFPGLVEGQAQSFPELVAGDGGNKTASAAKPRMLLAADTVRNITEEFLEPGEIAVIDSLAEDLKGKISGEEETPAEVAKTASSEGLPELKVRYATLEQEYKRLCKGRTATFIVKEKKAELDSLATQIATWPKQAGKGTPDLNHPRMAIGNAFKLVQKFQIDGEMDQSLIVKAIALLNSIAQDLYTPGQEQGVRSAIKHLDDYMTYDGGADENLARAYTDLEDLCNEMKVKTPTSPVMASTDDTGVTTGLRNQPDYGESDSYTSKANEMAGDPKKARRAVDVDGKLGDVASDPNWQPDIFDLNDYIATRHPEVYQATKYLPAPEQMKVWDPIYNRDLANESADVKRTASMKLLARRKVAAEEWTIWQDGANAYWQVVDNSLTGEKVLGKGTAPNKAEATAAMKVFLEARKADQLPPHPFNNRLQMQAGKQAKKLVNPPLMTAKRAFKLVQDYVGAYTSGGTEQLTKAIQWLNSTAPQYFEPGEQEIFTTAVADIQAFLDHGDHETRESDALAEAFTALEDFIASKNKATQVVACEGASLVRNGNTFELKAASGHTEPLRVNASKVKWARPLQFTLAFRAAVETYIRNPRSEVNKTADVPLTFENIWSDIAEDMGPAPVVTTPGEGKAPAGDSPKTEAPKSDAPKPESTGKSRMEKLRERRDPDGIEDENFKRIPGKQPKNETDEKDEDKPESKEAAFDMFIPGQVISEFYPELQAETVDFPGGTSMGTPSDSFDPAIGLPGGSPSGVQQSSDGLPADGDAYVSTDPTAAMGLGRDGKPQILEGAPLRTEMDIRGYGFDQEFYAQAQGISPKAFSASYAVAKINKKASTEEFRAQFADFLKKAMGEIAATFIAAFKVTSRPLMNKVPGTGEINLSEMEHNATFVNGQVLNVSSRVAYLMSKLTDSDIKEAINGAWSQSAVWNEDSNGGFTYECFVRPETLDKQTMILKYNFVVGTKGL